MKKLIAKIKRRLKKLVPEKPAQRKQIIEEAVLFYEMIKQHL